MQAAAGGGSGVGVRRSMSHQRHRLLIMLVMPPRRQARSVSERWGFTLPPSVCVREGSDSTTQRTMSMRAR